MTQSGSDVPGNFARGERVLKKSVEYREQKERGSGDGSPQVRGSAQYANE
jgi:hypothetical protein